MTRLRWWEYAALAVLVIEATVLTATNAHAAQINILWWLFRR